MIRKEFKNFVKMISGEDGLKVAQALKSKDYTSEFLIAENLEMEINHVRNLLYKLFHYNLASFIRKKDKTKGWYVYYWILNKDNIPFVIGRYLKERIAKVNEQIEIEKNNIFFVCPNKCMRLDFDKATEFNYLCPECGELLVQDKQEGRVEEMENELNDLITRYNYINELINKLNAKRITITGAIAAKQKRNTKRSRYSSKNKYSKGSRGNRSKVRSNKLKRTRLSGRARRGKKAGSRTTRTKR